MRLVYKKDGKEVKIGDTIDIGRTPEEKEVEVMYFRPPHKPSSSGKVSVKFVASPRSQEFYVSVIGAEWIEREDQGWSPHNDKCKEYWDRGLNCPHIPQEEQDRIKSALKRGDDIDDIIDPGWGQFD